MKTIFGPTKNRLTAYFPVEAPQLFPLDEMPVQAKPAERPSCLEDPGPFDLDDIRPRWWPGPALDEQ